MNVLIVGANNRTGQRVLELLNKSSHQAYCLVHDENLASLVRSLGAEPMFGEITDSLQLEGMHAVIYAVDVTNPSIHDTISHVTQHGAIHFIRECEKAGIERFVMLSSVYADKPDEAPCVLYSLLEETRMTEDYLTGSSRLKYTIVRPGKMIDSDGTFKILVAESIDDDGMISRNEVAQVLVDTLETDTTFNKKFYCIEGPFPIKEALAEV